MQAAPKSADTASAGKSAFSAFVKQRRAGGGAGSSLLALQREWKSMSPDERASFEQEAVEHRKSGAESTAATFLRQQQRKQLSCAATRPLPAAEPRACKRRKDSAAPAVAVPVPTPLFPKAGGAALHAEQKERRQGLVTTLRAQVQERGAQVTAPASHDTDLEVAAEQVGAPTLSFDWHSDVEEPDAAEEEEDALEVRLPDRGTAATRDLLRQELTRKASIAQVRSLVFSSKAS